MKCLTASSLPVSQRPGSCLRSRFLFPSSSVTEKQGPWQHVFEGKTNDRDGQNTPFLLVSSCRSGTLFHSPTVFASANVREKGCFVPPDMKYTWKHGEFLVTPFNNTQKEISSKLHPPQTQPLIKRPQMTCPCRSGNRYWYHPNSN